VRLWTKRDPVVPTVRHNITKFEIRNGKWYAFDFKGRKFYATVYNNGLTGHLELTEIPDPYEHAAERGEAIEAHWVRRLAAGNERRSSEP
jgi:hypothetical protein